MARGSVPADVEFIGEAPGESEDVLGQPFKGPAGKLLDDMILKALQDGIEAHYGLGPAPPMLWTNLVGCIPKSEETRRKNVEPLPEEIEACRPRLDTLVRIARPKLIVAVGDLAERYSKLYGYDKKYQWLSIRHPAFLLRLDISRQGLEIQRTIVNLSAAFLEMVEKK